MASHDNVFAQEKLASHHSDVFILEKNVQSSWRRVYLGLKLICCRVCADISVELELSWSHQHSAYLDPQVVGQKLCNCRGSVYEKISSFFSLFFFFFFFLDRFLLITVFPHSVSTRDELFLASRITVSAYRAHFRDVWISMTFYSIFVGMYKTW